MHLVINTVTFWVTHPHESQKAKQCDTSARYDLQNSRGDTDLWVTALEKEK